MGELDSAAGAVDTRLMSDSSSYPRKKIAFDPGSLHALERLALDRGITLQALADEAFRDLLRKHWRPVTLADALRESARLQPANDVHSRPSRRRG